MTFRIFPAVVILALFGIAIFFTGCAEIKALGVLDEVQAKGTAISGKVLDGAAKAVDAYGNKTPDKVRAWFRDEVNSRTEDWDILIVPSE